MLKPGDKAIFKPAFPFYEATLVETGRRVWVCGTRSIIVGAQGATTIARLLLDQPVIKVDENTVKLRTD